MSRDYSTIHERIMCRADAKYAAIKLKKAGLSSEDIVYTAPETLPRIESDQVKALAFAIASILEEMEGGD